MYLHLGYGAVVDYDDVVGVFDLDNVSASARTREFLKQEEAAGNLELLGERLPVAMVLCGSGTYLSPLSAGTLQKRLADHTMENALILEKEEI